MARKVFFSFHHQHDSWRVGQVRNSWLTKGEENAFLDAAAWEKVKKKGDASVKAWIDRELKGTSVTVVLIGEKTAARRWVRYELRESYKRGNGLVGVYIHGIKDQNQQTSSRGRNPLDDIKVNVTRSFLRLWDYEVDVSLSDSFSTYYWFDDNGRENLATWIEEAATKAGR
jgi:Thoeris protein ThsB, TIR-like domain